MKKMSGSSSFVSDKYICNPRNPRGGGKKKKKEITRPSFSRCSMSRLQSYMKEISKGNNLIERLALTPFGHFLQGPIITLDMLGIEYLRNNWDEQRKGFSINGIFIKFTVKDVAIILGLSRVGDLVKFDNKSPDTTFYKKEFKGKVITRKVLEKMLKALVGDNGVIMDEEKILKLSILYIFCTFLFCGISYTLNPLFVNYVEDLTNIHTYNWAEAVHRYLIEDLSRSLKENATSFSGCGILLNVWLYEHCQLFADGKVEGVYPYLFRWAKVKSRRRNTFFNILKDMNKEMITFEIESEAKEEGFSDKEKEGGDINKQLVVRSEDVHREDIQDTPVYEDMPDVISQEGIPNIHTQEGILDRECTIEIDKLKDDLERVTVERDELLIRYNQLQTDVAKEKKGFKYATMVENTQLKSTLDDFMSKVKSLVQEKLDMQEAINSQTSEFQATIKELNDEKESLQVASEAQVEEYKNKIKEIREEYEKKLHELTSSYNRLKDEQEEDSVKEENDDNDNDGEGEKAKSKGERKRRFFSWALVSSYAQVTKRKRIVETEAIEVDENALDKPYIDEGFLEMKRATLRDKSEVTSLGNLSDSEDGRVARKMRSTRDEGTSAFKDHGSKGALTRRAEMYQEYMSLIPIPAQRGSLVPCTSWQGLAKSMKELYGQPLHYLTNILLKQWDQSRIGHNDEYQSLDTIIHPSKAEALIWITEEVHRLSTSHHYLTKLWASDAMYHMSIDPIFP